MSNLPTIQFESLFSEAFDTFKVFKSLSIVTATRITPGTSKNIWQILNHLILWQENQLLLIQGKKPEKHISEIETWIKTEVPHGQSDIDNAVDIFDGQISKIKTIASTLSLSESNFELKFRKILDVATHLSFHLGEIILLRRQCGNYPMPEDMPAFLEKDQ
ncbi:MAG: hypothetical protein V4577_30950 [Bacteroidota bacterium]